jgi:hypothetical protein
MTHKYLSGDIVRFHSTSDANLDGRTGEVIGKHIEDSLSSFYIVQLNTDGVKTPWCGPHTEGPPWKAIVITEHCLKPMCS